MSWSPVQYVMVTSSICHNAPAVSNNGVTDHFTSLKAANKLTITDNDFTSSREPLEILLYKNYIGNDVKKPPLGPSDELH